MSTTIPDLRPMLAQIATQLEANNKRMIDIEVAMNKTREDVAFIRGLMTNIPNVFQTFMISFGVLGLLPLLATLAVYGLRRFGAAP